MPLRSPYFDFEFGGLVMGNRFDALTTFWAHVGLYLFERINVAVRVGSSQSEVNEHENQEPPLGYTPVFENDAPNFFFNPVVGVVLTNKGSFIIAPSASFVVTDKSRFGYAAGVMVPFVWVTRSGFRIGFQGSLLASFGGSIRFRCGASGVEAPCDQGEVREFGRERSSGFSAGFLFGYGLE